MPPHSNQQIITQRAHRSWWKPLPILNERVISYFNNRLAPKMNWTQIEKLTRPALHHIFYSTLKFDFFEIDNHFFTINSYYVEKEQSKGEIICTSCYQSTETNETYHNVRKLQSNDHFTLPDSLIYTLITMPSLWCNNCSIQLFIWYDRYECPWQNH